MAEVNNFRKIKTEDKSLSKVQDGVANLALQVINKVKEYTQSFRTSVLTATTGTITTLVSTTATITSLTATLGYFGYYKLDGTDNDDDAITSGGAGIDVAGKSALLVNTSGGNIQIDNLSGGVVGQVLHIVKTNGANTLTLLNSNSTGGNAMLFPGGASKAINNLGGITLIALDSGGTLYWFGLNA